MFLKYVQDIMTALHATFMPLHSSTEKEQENTGTHSENLGKKKCKELSDNCNHQEIENKEECFYRKKYGVVKDSRQGQIVATPER